MAGEEVLIADSSAKDRVGLVALVERRGLVPSAVDSAAMVREKIVGKFFAVALIDLDLDGDAVNLLQFIRERSSGTQLIALTSHKNFDAAVAAFRAGSIDTVLKRPEEVARLELALEVALSRYRESTGSGNQEVANVLDGLVKTVIALGRQVYASEIDSLTQVSRTKLLALLVDDDQKFLNEIGQGLSDLPIETQIEISGGGALDRIGSSRFDLIIAHQAMGDLSGSIVVNAAQQRNPDCVGLVYVNRGASGRIERVVDGRVVDTYAPFASADDLIERVRQLADEEHLRRRERRVLQVLGQKHGDLLRRYGEIKRRFKGLGSH